MSARNRPRGSQIKDDGADAHEELTIWKQLNGDIGKLKTLNQRAAEVSEEILKIEAKLGADTAPTIAEIDALQHLYREGLKLAEEEQKILNEEPNDVIKNIGILTALRNASEIDPPRAANVKSRNQKRKFDADGSVESPGPSPSVSSTASRFKGASVRSGSVPSATRDGRDASLKLEDGDISKGAMAERMGGLIVGADVAYKQSKAKGVEGDWIQCTIQNIVGDGNKKRFEVQDAAPEDSGTYKTSAASLIPIQKPGIPLPDYPKGKQVLGLYPDTTCFYRAEVVSTNKKDNTCKLRFEGEEELNKEVDVERRFVLDLPGR
ncbi:MAG: hypothetical protein M1819_005651 [Sarea resinae]|nr:MAG: hypothetical protein M1819_005651 [Sarea resinae]